MEDISNGLEPYPISLLSTIDLGSFETYITDSIFPDGTSLISLKGIPEQVSQDVSTQLSETSAESSTFSDELDADQEDTWVCSCSMENDGGSAMLCTVGDGEECDCVSSFGNFYSIPSIEGYGQNLNHQLLNLDALPDKLPLVECSPQCPCAERCANRLTQRGVRIPLSVQPSSSGIGLGLLYTPSNGYILPKGSFISLYAGEYLTTAEARRRWKEDKEKQNKIGEGNYILSLRLSEETWHIDPRYKGNIGRFLNHSCEPNCVIQIVRWGVGSLPRAAIFTKGDVQKREELTFDYANASGSIELERQLDEGATDKEAMDGIERTKCLCGSRGCRGWMPFDETL